MTIEYDESGKYFTNVIKKKPTEVYIQTTAQLIHGIIHLKPDNRIKDEIDEQVSLAITDATVYGNEGTVIFRSHFLAVNKTQIIWVIPCEDMVV